MALLRKIFTRKRAHKQAPGEINGVVPKEPAAEQAMSESTDNEVEATTNQVSGLTLQDADTYNPDTVPYEVATFALS